MRTSAILYALCIFFLIPAHANANQHSPYAGSSSCRECHEKFYTLWSSSMHGLAMQPYSKTFAREKITQPQQDIFISKQTYRADIKQGIVLEKSPEKTR